jgi:hypothetical protein
MTVEQRGIEACMRLNKKLTDSNNRLRRALESIADEEQLAHSQECPHELARAALEESQ